MKTTRTSFAVHTALPERVVEATVRRSEEGGTGLLLLSGALVSEAADIARDLAVEVRGTDWLIACCAGVLTEEGEIERESAAVGMVFPKGTQAAVYETGGPEFGEATGRHFESHPGTSVLLLVRGDSDEDGWLAELSRHFSPSEPPAAFGGGTLPGIPLLHVAEGVVANGAAAALHLPRSRPARFRSSSACRLISQLGEVTRSRGKILHEIDGMPALELLNQSTGGLPDHPLVLLAIAEGDNPLSSEGRNVALRAIQGVDPGRGALIMGDELRAGTRVAFAVRDDHSARVDLEAQLRGLGRSCAGTAPDFGIYVSCAGRGRGLYGTDDVDVRLIRKTFGQIPLIGMHSTFELAPLGSRLVPQIYTGVLGVFCRPS